MGQWCLPSWSTFALYLSSVSSGQGWVLHCLCWEWSPSQSLRSQSLSLVLVPPPQLRVHRDQDLHPDQEPGTGPAGNLSPAIIEQLTKLSNLHRLFLQVLVLTGSPLQSSPPFAGAGESQYLVWDWLPPPQLLEHLVQDFQPPHCPSTKNIYSSFFWKRNKVERSQYLYSFFGYHRFC